MSYTNESITLDTQVQLREIMRKNPKTIDIEETVADAAMKMCKKDQTGSCIVLKNNVAVGIVTEQDINCKVVAKNLLPSDVLVKEIMTSPLITLTPENTVEEASHLMIKNRVRRLPLVNEKGTVIGIVTVRDIVAVSAEINDLMTELARINRKDEISGVCSKCGKMSETLTTVDGSLVCKTCNEDDAI